MTAKNNFFTFFLVILVCFITLANISISLSNKDFLAAKRLTLSFSKGDQYYGRLQLFEWYLLHNRLAEAQALESQLDPADIITLKQEFYPQYIYQRLGILSTKVHPSVDDLIEIAKLEVTLGQTRQAVSALERAYRLDPIRTDLKQLYFGLAAAIPSWST